MIEPLTSDELVRALEYPYRIPTTHFVFDAATCETHLRPGLALTGARAVGEHAGAMFYDIDIQDGDVRKTLNSVCAVVASGSNASPDQMARKFRDNSQYAFVSMQLKFSGLISVYSAHFARYGAIAATLSEYAGASSRLMMTFLPAPELDLMHKTESLGVQYDFKPVPVDAFAQPRVVSFSTYYYASRSSPVLTCADEPILLSAFEVRNCPLRRATEREVLTRAIASLFPGRDFLEVLTEIVRSPEVRRDAIARLNSIRIDFNEPVLRPAD